MKIAFASDHAGFAMKELVKTYVEKTRKFKILDLGTYSEESVDYPIYGEKIGKAVAGGDADLGIAVCGSGIGISIAANKVKGARCALCHSVEYAHMAKQHNNANILALGGRYTKAEEAYKIIDEWLDTEFEGGRHQRRVDELDNL